MIYRFITDKNIDILYVLMGNIGCRTEYHKQIEFLNNLPDIPIVTLYTKFDGFPSVTFNNRIGLENVIRHIIIDHHVTKIGFVSGPVETSQDAKERLETYRNTMEDRGLDAGDDWIVYGNFSEFSSSTAVIIKR